MRNAEPGRHTYTVSDLNQAVQHLLSNHFPLLWVEGELSNLARAPSGHMYFSLKDEHSQIRCAMFASKNRLLDFTPQNGQQLLVRGRVGLYQARGDFQLILEDMEPCGEGALRLAYERLKKQLHNAGLFDESHKQRLPVIPQKIGIVSSPTGAAIRDTLHVLERRFPQAEITLYPTLVQGDKAATGICQALKQAERHAQCDTLLLVRGGGSIEDLWCFNEQSVAQAIYDCPIPLITGIGHEIDFTIADFVADLRAPTPSAAAEMATPDQWQLKKELGRFQKRLQSAMEMQCQAHSQHLDRLWQRLTHQHPAQQIQRAKDQLRRNSQQLTRALQRRHEQQFNLLQRLQYRLQHYPVTHSIQAKRSQLHALLCRLNQTIDEQIKQNKHCFQLAAQSLHHISPLATLGRGYALVNNTDGALVKSARQVNQGDDLTIKLEKGQLQCTTTRITPDKNL